MNKRETGTKMELLAVNYLESLGYVVLERNFYMRGGELDITAIDGDELVFVEVKYRHDVRFGSAAEAVTLTKRRALIKTAKYFIMKHPEHEDRNVRFDVLAIDGNEIELIRAAFDAF